LALLEHRGFPGGTEGKLLRNVLVVTTAYRAAMFIDPEGKTSGEIARKGCETAGADGDICYRVVREMVSISLDPRTPFLTYAGAKTVEALTLAAESQ
jgi:hypothetical protein